jgi:hypothetical protein
MQNVQGSWCIKRSSEELKMKEKEEWKERREKRRRM